MSKQKRNASSALWRLLMISALATSPLLASSAHAHMRGMYATKAEAEKRAAELKCKGAFAMRSNHVCTMKHLNRRSRKLHRLVVPIAAIPLALTSMSGAIYGTVLAMNIDAPWLLRLHTGNFGIINLQPIYSPLIGVMTLVLIASGITLLVGGRRTPNSIQN
ncbi:MAG: hypothetical protein EBT85_01135 [Synechococcaceae bacterium WB5_2B_268]|nr:hypothetical protein [Synechococcaceae bacterium WB5_2B_268]